MKQGWQREPTDGWLVGWLAGWLVGWLEDLIGSNVTICKLSQLQVGKITASAESSATWSRLHSAPNLSIHTLYCPCSRQNARAIGAVFFGMVAVVTSPTTNGCSVVWCGVA